MRIPSGKTNVYLYFVAVDSTDLKTRETGITGWTVYRSRNGAAPVVYTTPTVTELSAANMPGVYALLIDEDTTITSGADSEEVAVHITATGVAPVTRTFELYRREITSGETVAVSSGAITTATNVTTVNGLAANVITASSIAADAIGASELAADAASEIGTAVWAAATRTLTAATNITSTGASVPITAGGLVSSDVTAISTDTTAANNAESFFDGTGYAGTNNVIPTVTTVTNGVTVTTNNDKTGYALSASGVDAIWDEATAGHVTAGTYGVAITDILTDTAEIGAAGAGLTAIPWNALWDAEVQSEVNDGLVAYGAATATDVTTAAANVSVDEIQATALADLFNTDSGTTYASAVAGSVVKEIADNAGGTSLTVADIADGVWREVISAHDTVVGSAAEALSGILTDTTAIEVDTQDIQSRLPAALDANGFMKADLQFGGDTVAAGNFVDEFDGTGYTGGSILRNTYPQALGTTAVSQINAEVDTALADIHLDHLLAVDYDPASKPGTATALLNELVESDAGVSRFTANALEQAPSGTGATPAQIWDYAASSATVVGSMGEVVNAILTDTAEIGVAGAGLTNINLPDQTMNITGNLSGSVGSVTGTVGGIAGTITTLDALDTAQDSQHSTTQAAIATAQADLDILTGTDGVTLATSQPNYAPATASALTTVATNVTDILTDTGTTLPSQISGLNNLSQADIRTAVGLASANMDTQLSTIDTVADGIKAVTDNLPNSGALTDIAADATAAKNNAATAIAVSV